MTAAIPLYGTAPAALEVLASTLNVDPAALRRGLGCLAECLAQASRAGDGAENADLPAQLGVCAAAWFATLPAAPTELTGDPEVISRIVTRLQLDPEASVGDLLAVGSGLLALDVPAQRGLAAQRAPLSPGVLSALLSATSYARVQSTRAPRLITKLFAEQAAAHPDRLSIDCINGSMTFAELELRTRAMAHHLMERGVGRDSVVAVIAPRDRSLIMALLGTLRAGAAFLLIDPHDPHDLSRYKLEAAAARLILCAPAFVAQWGDAQQPVVVLDATTPVTDTSRTLPAIHGQDLAYVVFTSGSTGRPKGVLIEHTGLAEHLATQLAPFYDAVATPETALRVGGTAPVSFDSFIDQVLPMIALGHTLVLFDEHERMTPARFLACGPSAVDVIDCAPSQLTVLVEHGILQRPQPLRLIVFGGESPNQYTWDQLRASGVPAVSIYGATECTIGSMVADVHEYEQVNIGFPDGSARIYVLDEAGDVVAPGVVGEVYLAGPGVGRGFVGAPAETARLFVPDPFSGPAGARMYRTGDMARMDGSGRLYFCGRRDDQIKIRGFRIELGEVEAALMAVPGIKQAAVIPAPASGPATHLAAFFVGGTELAWSFVKDQLAQRLPAHMIPRRAVQLEALPLTRNGKVDRRALSTLDTGEARQAAGAEEQQLELWPSMGDFFIYDDMLYYMMTNDERRNAAYRAAIGRLVRDKIVLDIGTGKDAILARLCIEAGARKVYAVELLDESYRKAQALLAALGLSERITLLHGDVRSVALPEPIDVCVSELLGGIGGSEGAAVIINDARRFLTPEGRMLPERSVTQIAAVSLPESFWSDLGFSPVTGRYVEQIFEQVGYPFDLRVCLRGASYDNLISNDAAFEDLDFTRILQIEDQHTVTLTIDRAARLDGFVLWMRLHVDQYEQLDILDHDHCWLPVFIPAFYPGIAVHAGDLIEVTIVRTLNANGLNPDYALRGVLRRQDGTELPFEVSSAHDQRTYRAMPFYRALFAGDSVPVRSGAGAAQVGEDHAPRPEPPANELELWLRDIWQDVLKRDDIGVLDDFEAIGGHSLATMEIITRIQKDVPHRFDLRAALAATTVRELAAVLAEASSSS